MTRADLAAAACALRAAIELEAATPGADLDALARRVALMTQLLTPPPKGTRWVVRTEEDT